MKPLDHPNGAEQGRLIRGFDEINDTLYIFRVRPDPVGVQDEAEIFELGLEKGAFLQTDLQSVFCELSLIHI